MKKRMKFDVAIINPPYDKGLCDKFQKTAFDMTNNDGQIIWVAPSTWLFGKRQNKRITKLIDKYYTEIKTIIPSDYFDADINSLMSTVYIDKTKEHKIIFDDKEYERCSDIKHYTNDDILISIFNKIGCKHLKSNIHQHIYKQPNAIKFYNNPVVENPDLNWWCYRALAYAGHSSSQSRKRGEFYSMVSKRINYDDACGQYKDLCMLKDNANKPFLQYYIAFETEKELKNFWNYIHTDFVRICLYFIKTTIDLSNGELKYVPWLDFKEEWTDEKLFQRYHLTEKEIKHIYEILPNYYNINRIY